jgi:hypothetical protein
MSHLTPEQIERYATRSGSVDEILAVAQHFEVCPECRDRAAALLDSGEGEVTITRRHRRVSGPHAVAPSIARRSVSLWWVVGATLLAVAIVIVVLRFT